MARQGSLVHIVYLNLKDDLKSDERDILVKEINRLGEIENVEAFRIGFFEDLGDKRALATYEFTMEMVFKDRSQYNLYQQDPIHDEVQKATGKFLDGPPATYDYVIR